MTDRLQQKAREIVVEGSNGACIDDPSSPTSAYYRQYAMAFRGLTAGIAMAAEVCDERVITAYRYGNRESEQCAIAIRALAKGETQHGG